MRNEATSVSLSIRDMFLKNPSEGNGKGEFGSDPMIKHSDPTNSQSQGQVMSTTFNEFAAIHINSTKYNFDKQKVETTKQTVNNYYNYSIMPNTTINLWKLNFNPKLPSMPNPDRWIGYLPDSAKDISNAVWNETSKAVWYGSDKIWSGGKVVWSGAGKAWTYVRGGNSGGNDN